MGVRWGILQTLFSSHSSNHLAIFSFTELDQKTERKGVQMEHLVRISLIGEENASEGGPNVQVTSTFTTEKCTKDGRLSPSEDNFCRPL